MNRTARTLVLAVAALLLPLAVAAPAQASHTVTCASYTRTGDANSFVGSVSWGCGIIVTGDSGYTARVADLATDGYCVSLDYKLTSEGPWVRALTSCTSGGAYSGRVETSVNPVAARIVRGDGRYSTLKH